jgi:hypothetical protein
MGEHLPDIAPLWCRKNWLSGHPLVSTLILVAFGGMVSVYEALHFSHSYVGILLLMLGFVGTNFFSGSSPPKKVIVIPCILWFKSTFMLKVGFSRFFVCGSVEQCVVQFGCCGSVLVQCSQK